MKNLVLRAYHKIPIYEKDLFLYVSHNARNTYNRVAVRWNLKQDDDNFKALSIMDGDGSFAIFIRLDQLCENTIAHEVDHTACYIRSYIGHKPNRDDEPRAYLVGHIAGWIKKQLKRANL